MDVSRLDASAMDAAFCACVMGAVPVPFPSTFLAFFFGVSSSSDVSGSPKSSSSSSPPRLIAKRWSLSSEVPTARRLPAGSTSMLQHSAPSAATVCAQCWVSRSHTLTVASLLQVTSRTPEDPVAPADDDEAPPPPCAASASAKTASVTWSLWPRSLHRPVSATTSHTTTLVSLPPDTSMEPLALNRSAVTSDRWPLRSTSVDASSRDHSRMVPSAWPAATRSLPSARAMRVTAGSAPDSRGGGRRLLASTPRRTSHTARRSSAAVTRCLPVSSYTGGASGEATTPKARACS